MTCVLKLGNMLPGMTLNHAIGSTVHCCIWPCLPMKTFCDRLSNNKLGYVKENIMFSLKISAFLKNSLLTNCFSKNCNPGYLCGGPRDEGPDMDVLAL